MRTSFHVTVVAASLMLLVCAAAAQADEYRIDLTSLEGLYSYTQSDGPVTIDLGTALIALESIELELAGSNAQGYWSGGLITADEWKSGLLAVTMDSASSFPDQWGDSFRADADGTFTTTLSLHRSGGGTDWSFLADGVTDIAISNSVLASIDGGFSLIDLVAGRPSYDLTDVVLVINATPVPEPASLSLAALGGLAVLRRRR